jgi:hypothetical protein
LARRTASSKRWRSPKTISITRAARCSCVGARADALQGMDNAEIINTVHARRAPMIPVSTALRL